MTNRCAQALSFLLVVLLIFPAGCNLLEKKPLQIGFVGGLTGRTASLGVAGRDGTLLAVEEVNRAGGIDGRPVELVIRDDMQNEAEALKIVREFIDMKLPVVIGPMTSSMGVVMAPEISRSDTLMVSPTVGTMLLGQQDDNFLRVYPQCMMMSRSLAEFAYHEKSLRRFVIIYDVGNSAFTESWKTCFSEQFSALGGEIVAGISFTSGGQHRFLGLMEEAFGHDPDGILILANSLDTALLAQQGLKMGKAIPLFTSEWSMTRDLLSSGGQSVEGITLFHTFNEASREKRFLDFKERYVGRFSHPPSFPAIHAYDATRIVLEGLRGGARSGAELKQTLLQQASFETLQGELSFNAYGDVNRDLFLTVVREGEFIVVRKVPVTDQ